MTVSADTGLRNQIIYSVFVRNHTKEGTFRALEQDLPRIKSLGTDILWLMPVQPIGEKNKKGSSGSPYSVHDYRRVNPELGSGEDLSHLIDKIHENGMKCMVDVVFNHTSPDSTLAQKRPEWFYRNADGSLGSKTDDWSDVADLDYSNRELWDFQIETLRIWAETVDGFRCDVASLIPLDFWKRARREVDSRNSDCVWLAETVHADFIMETRNRGFIAHSDGEVFQAFDICYDYDIMDYYDDYLSGDIPLSRYLEMVQLQEAIYPANYVKLRFLENHDHKRAKALIPDQRALRNWTAFLYLLRGATLIYAGQEVCSDHTPSLFDPDPIDWETGLDLSPLMVKLAEIHRDPLLRDGRFTGEALDRTDTAVLRYEKDGRMLQGFFSLRGRPGRIRAGLPDGVYANRIDGEPLIVRDGRLELTGEPVILRGSRSEDPS